jgi:hypothetical protein
MAHPSAATVLWNWFVEGRTEAADIRSAIESVLVRPVVPLGVAAFCGQLPDEVLCDVWHGSGDFPTLVDCYGVPASISEFAVVGAVARRLGRRCLVPDNTLDPSRFILADRDGTLHQVDADVTEGDCGAVHTNVRLWRDTREMTRCQSRWLPDPARA